jgi:signal transduction histidine kinase
MGFAAYDGRPRLRYRRSMTSPAVDADLDRPLIRRLAARRFTPAQLIAVDVAVVTFVIVIVEFAMTRRTPRVSGSGWAVAGWSAYLVAAAATLTRHRLPRLALAIVFPIALATLCLRAGGPTVFLVVLTLYSVVTTSSRQVASIVTAVVVGSILAATLIGGGEQVAQAAIAGVALILLGWLAGENVKAGRRYDSQHAERAAQHAAAVAAERAEQVSLALAEERAQIARDLHDIVAHAMSVIAVRSGVARMVIDSDPAEARAALAIIETTTRRSLHEMRLLVGVLRNPDDRRAELSPAPGLDDLEQLVADTAVAGVSAELVIAGTVRPLSPAADVSAYRILQEALTNVVRHAGPTQARVQITYRPGGVSLEVTDDGPGGSAPRPAGRPGTGHGLIGMRERATLFGGSLEAGPHGDGFRVLATLPTGDLGADPLAEGGVR